MPNNDMSAMKDLPVPDAGARTHSQRVVNKIIALIRENDGVISFADYMALVLHAPGLGYYSAGSRKFGHGGDFITAPELSSLFSACVAIQCRQVLQVIDSPVIIETGPGTGKMACDVLVQLEALEALPEQYVMLETSADLRQRQQQLLKERIPHLQNLIHWWECLPDTPIDGLILGNEVLDAMPVHRVRFNNHCFTEIGVTCTEEGLNWAPFPLANQKLLNEIERRMSNMDIQLPENYQTEFNLNLNAWVHGMADILNKGAMLLIDYGYTRAEYYHPQRHDGTLLCHYRHRSHDDPFYYPGLQDITASVDFTAVAEIAEEAGLHVSGFTTQAHFLMACGLLELMQANQTLDEIEQVKRSNEVKMLTMPVEMGERFKVMALSKNLHIDWQGFRMKDLRARL